MARRKVDANSIPAGTGPGDDHSRAGDKRVLTAGDLLNLCDEFAQTFGQQPGEYTRAEMLERFGGKEWALKKFLKANRERIGRRRVGSNEFVYWLK